MRMIPLILLALATPASVVADERLDFSRDIRPILSEYCFACHGPDEATRKARLRLDLADSALAERAGGRAIVPGDVAASQLVQRITAGDPADIMPPVEVKHPLSPESVAILKQWIEEGAPYADHWAFVAPKIRSVPVPSTGASTSASTDARSNEVDAFIHVRLDREGVSPSPRANKETLIRRVTFDLTGLPPSEAEIDAFLADDDPRAYPELVKSLLVRDATAERLALEWLDVARYADTNGYSIDDHRDMWPWRDWVIEAFRENKRYDTFIVEQLAGDLLPDATLNQRLATGFLRNAMNTHEGGTIAEEYRVASIIDKLDTVGTAFMGLTVKCAQCHDHKYDPISQREYYRLFALFNQTSEGGMGSDNGNTPPTLELGNDWGERNDIVAAHERRRTDLTVFLGQQFVDGRRAWEAGLEPIGDLDPASARGPHEVFTAADARWVWAPDVSDGDSLRVTRSLVLDAVPKVAELAISCDNRAEVFLNGDRLTTVDPWMKPFHGDVTDRLRVGENTLRIEASNQGGVAGLLVGLVDEEDQRLLSTTAAWTFTREAGDANGLASEGVMKDLGSYGAAPWGHFASPKSPALEARRVAELPEEERDHDDWRALLEVFAHTLDSGNRTLLERQLLAIKGEMRLIDRFLKQRNPNVMVLDEGDDRATRMLMRGQYDQPGEEVSAGVPAFLSWPGLQSVTNRLELARWLTDERHPLTARVTVNRYWQMLMGRGLVETSEDFGSQGAWPSHPELLDWLAVSFMEHGWDVRWLLETILMSSTYQQSSRFTDELRERDPNNRLIARGSRRRLPGEAVRDGALFIAGLLSTRTGGPSVYPDQPDGLWRQVSHFGYPGFYSAQSFYPSVGKDRYRRSMYTFWKRTAPPPAMVVFDAPSRETCTVRRPITNTPLQALVTLNEPQFMNAARSLGARMILSSDGRPGRVPNIATAFRRCTSRLPSAAELEILRRAYARHLARYRTDPEAARVLTRSTAADDETVARLAAATIVASTLLNLDETLTRP